MADEPIVPIENPPPPINEAVNSNPTPPSGIRGRVSNGFNRLLGRGPITPTPKTPAPIQAVQTGEKVAKTGANAVKVAKTGMTMVRGAMLAAGAATSTPILVPILIVVLLIGGSVAAMAVSVGVGASGVTGSTFHQSSASEQQQETLSNAGDIIARRQLDATNIATINTLLDALKAQAQTKPPQGVTAPDTAAIKLIDDLKAKLATYTSSDSKVDQNALNDMISIIHQLNAKGYDGVPASEIGLKIASLARYYASDQAGVAKYSQCSVDDPTACNEFAIKVMHETGADPNYSGVALDQYNYTKNNTTCYTTFTINPTSATDQLKLSQGDIIYRPYPIGGMGHVGIYVGNGQLAAASYHGHNPLVDQLARHTSLTAVARLKGGPCAKK